MIEMKQVKNEDALKFRHPEIVILVVTKSKEGKIDIAIIHYEGVRLHEAQLVNIADLVIVDEAQAIANKDSIQSKIIDKITDKAKHILLLSGGVAQNRIAIQLFNPLHILDRKMWSSFYKWKDDWCSVETIEVPLFVHGKKIYNKTTKQVVRRKVSQIIGIKKPEALAVAVAPYIYQKKKIEVAEQLPPKLYQTIDVELYPKQIDLYEQVRDEIETAVRGLSISNTLVKLLRLFQICNTLSCLDLEDISAKADDAVELMLELSPENKALVFSQFVPMANSVYNRLKKEGANVLLLTGEVPKNKRDDVRTRFKEDPSIQFLVASVSIEGTGSSYNMCTYLYRLDRVHTALLNVQVEDRIHRLDSKLPVNIIDFVALDTVEEVQLETINQKIEDINNVLEPASTYTKETIERMLKISPKKKKRR